MTAPLPLPGKSGVEADDLLAEYGAMADPPGIPEGSMRHLSIGPMDPSEHCGRAPWCKKPPGEEHETHQTDYHYAGEFSASVLLDESWDEPRLFIYHPDMPTGNYGVLIPLNQAEDLAQLMTALGQPGAAEAITRAVAAARRP